MAKAAAVVLVVALAVPAWAGQVAVDYLGHSCFTVQAEGGPVILIDPYGSYVPYPALPVSADVVLITHGHIDHCPYCFGEKDRVLGDPVVVWPFDKENRVREGNWKIVEGLTVRFVEATHVTRSGGGQGLVCLFSFEVEGIRFAHLGDLGRPLTAAQIAALGEVDVLFVPVGGAYTLDAAEAVEVVQQLPSVRVVLPMHYFVDGYCPWEAMAPVDGFLEAARAEGWMVTTPAASQVTLSADTLPASVEVWPLPFSTP